jgi:hypothetical protein
MGADRGEQPSQLAVGDGDQHDLAEPRGVGGRAGAGRGPGFGGEPGEPGGMT